MTLTTREEIKVGEVAVRFLVEGEQSTGSLSVFEFDVPAARRSLPPTATTATTRRSTGSRAR
jgi:hypothetical protein